MTATLDSAPSTASSRGSRLINAVRLQFVNPQTFVWVPLVVLAGAWALTLVIHLIIAGGGGEATMYSGGSQAPLWYFAVVGVQAMTLTFYFSQAMTLTRREFYLGALIAAAMSALGIAIVFVLLGIVEQATNGYGLGGHFAYLPWLWEEGPMAAGLSFFVLTMLAFILGFWFAIVFKRFGTMALTLILFALGFAILGIIAIITVNRAWLQVWAWFAETGSVELTMWVALCGAVFALGSYLTLRRMTI